jgi:hypothetical protein
MRKATAALSVLFVLVFLCVAGAAAQAPTGPPPGGAAGQPQANAPAQKQVIAVLKCTGNKTFTEAQILDASGIKVGDPMGQEVIRGALTRVVDYYRENGADLSLWVNIRPNGGSAKVELLIDETGTKGLVGRYEAKEGGTPGGPPLATVN